MKDFLDWAKPGGPEADLAARLDPERLPRHIAVIMDGNGRWAKRRRLPRVAGHRAGVDSVRAIVEACARLDLGSLTLYAFSVENWKRPQSEVDALFGLLKLYLRRELPTLKKHGIRMQAIGRIHELPRDVQEALDYATVETAAGEGLLLNVALNYGGRSEIVDAANALLAQARRTGEPLEVDEAAFARMLSTAGQPDPDLLIRTSGEVRVSNFLLWQIAYAEIWVTEKYWPEFRAADLLEALLDFQRRERRFGGLAEAGEGELVGARQTVSSLGEPTE